MVESVYEPSGRITERNEAPDTRIVISRQKCLFDITVQFFFLSRITSTTCARDGTTMMNHSGGNKSVSKCNYFLALALPTRLYDTYVRIYGYAGSEAVVFSFLINFSLNVLSVRYTEIDYFI